MSGTTRVARKGARRVSPTIPFASDAFNPRQPRDKNGRWISAGARIAGLLPFVGQNVAVHVEFASVKRPAELSKLLGVNVRGFRHGVSNQTLSHAIKQHSDPARQSARSKGIGCG